jgi:NACalpha-BTF3-like transcription factor
MLPEYIIAADLGQVNDPTAIVVAERRQMPTGRRERVRNPAAYFDGGEHLAPVMNVAQTAGVYDLVHLERLPLGTSYVAIPETLRTIEARIRQRWVELVWEETEQSASLNDAPVALVVDQTGVGRPVVDLLREHGRDPVAITITGGDQVIRAAATEYRVPKRNLAGAVQAALQARRLRAAAGLADWPALKRELQNFKAKISLSGHDAYGAGDDWREGNHDDLVLAVALAIWYGEGAA